jgi:chloride channel protein, CIC family
MSSAYPALTKENNSIRNRILHWFENQNMSDSGITIITALLVGIGAGLGAVLFRKLIDFFQMISYEKLGPALSSISPLHLILIPSIGGLIIGPLIYFFAREAKGHGVPEVMEAVALRGGRIRPQVAIVKALASSICIGTGGSVGREGPIVQIGSALGSTIGQMLNLSNERVRTLVACGAAGGIAATFNAPIAGAIFAIEVILGRLHSVYFGAVVISSVTASVIAQVIEGDARAFIVPEYSLVSPWELIFYALLGILAAIGAIGFTRLLYYSEDQWEKIPVPEYIKPAIGGILLGIIGILTFKIDGFPRVFGVGYESITNILFGELTLKVALLLFIIKIIATVTTLGSGGSGGVFAPSLFMGAMLGGSFGHIVNQFFPDISAPAGAYALVGMAAFFSGSARAPVTAILILFEMTGDYNIILPLMLTTVISTFFSQIISRETIYTLKLSRRGVHLEQGQDIDVMQGVTVEEIMTTEVDTVAPDLPLPRLSDLFKETHHHGFPVVENVDQLLGIVSITDLERSLAAGSILDKQVKDVATPINRLLIAYPDEPMWKAMKRMGIRDISRLPVVESQGSNKLVGIIRRRDIVRAYNSAIVKRAQNQHKIEALRLSQIDHVNFTQIDIPKDSPVVGQYIRQLPLPKDCLIVSVRRGRKVHIADGYTTLQGGDKVTIFAEDDDLSEIKDTLMGVREAHIADHHTARHKEIRIPNNACCIGKTVKELNIPPDCILVSIRRGDEIIIPHGHHTIEAGDVVEIFGLEDELSDLEDCLTG